MTDDMDSLEDMLKALEGPSGSGRGGAGRGGGSSRPPAKSNAPPPEDDDIDAFLSEIDAESRNSVNYGGGGRAPAASNAGRTASPSASQPVRSAPAGSRESLPPSRGGANAGGANRSMASNPNRSSVPPSSVNGPAELEAQGYEVHNNTGKWYSPAKTNKASDFRINGTTSTRVGFVHAITLRSLDDYGNPAKIDSPRDFIGITLTHQESGQNVQAWLRDNGDCTYNCAFFADQPGTIRMEIKLCGNPMFDINIQIDDIGQSLWVAKPRLPARPKELFIVDIVTVDGSRPEGVAPFEVQTMGDAEQLRLINNGDGTYKFQCVPQSNGHLTIQLSLHGQPIKDSPITVKVGDGRNQLKVKQESGPVEVISDTRPQNRAPVNAVPAYEEEDDIGVNTYNAEPVDDYNDPPPENYGDETYDDYGGGGGGGGYNPQDVSNDDLAALLDELGG